MDLGKVVLLISVSIIGIGSPSIVVTHHLTKEIISGQKEIRENTLPIEGKSFDDDWNQLKSNLSNLKGKITGLAFEEMNIIEGSKENKNPVREWCAKSQLKTYRSLISRANEDLLRDVRLACVLTIKNKLKSNEVLDTNGETDKEKFISNLEILKEYPNKDEKIVLEKDLLDLQKLSGTSKDDWQKLRDWCGKIYKRGYQGNNNIWKLVQKFCKR